MESHGIPNEHFCHNSNYHTHSTTLFKLHLNSATVFTPDSTYLRNWAVMGFFKIIKNYVKKSKIIMTIVKKL